MRRRALLALALLLPGCYGPESLRSAPTDQGARRLFPAPMPVVLPHVRKALAASSIVVREETMLGPVTVALLGERDMTTFSWGENVRVVVHGITPHETEVFVHSQRRLATNITARDTESFAADIFGATEASLRAAP